MSQLPKVELHLHLDCCLSYEAVRQLAPTVSEADYRAEFIAPPRCADLADYLRYPARSVELLQNRPALRLAVDDLFAQLERDHVIYAEIRFAPLLHMQQGLTPEAVVSEVCAATAAAIQRTGIEARLILCTLRHFSAAQSLQTAKLAVQFRGQGVAALDIAGDEANYPLAPHIAAFDYAYQHGLHITAHAGEASGAASVRETLAHLHPTRIGHGVRSIADPALIDQIKAQTIHLEVCPTCNVQTAVVETYAQHMVDQLYRQGVSLSINTDTRTITDITLAEEYAKLVQVFGWQAADFLACNLYAIQAAFVPDDVKARLTARLRDAMPPQP